MSPGARPSPSCGPRVQKDRHREIGNWLARRVARPSAVYGTWLAVRLGLSAHQVTLAALAGQPGGSGWRSAPGRGWVRPRRVGFCTWGSGSTTSTARSPAGDGPPSLDGVYSRLPDAPSCEPGAGLRPRLRPGIRTGDPAWASPGSRSPPAGHSCSLHNDCRYKAFFQRLKSTSETLLASTGGSGGRPAAPGPLAPARPGRPDLAGVQGVRASRRADRVDHPGDPGGVEPFGLARIWRLAVLGMAFLAARAGSRSHWTSDHKKIGGDRI